MRDSQIAGGRISNGVLDLMVLLLVEAVLVIATRAIGRLVRYDAVDGVR